MSWPRVILLTDGKIDLEKQWVMRRHGLPVRLSDLECQLLAVLWKATGPVAVSELWQTVWKARRGKTSRVVHQAVWRLRRKI
ncbi:MAG: winged helix-turn-helix domain-containing protein [Myxococcota bacterium]